MKAPRRRTVTLWASICSAILLPLFAAIIYLQITAAPIRKFSYDIQYRGRSLGHTSPSDPKLRAMVRRAQLDYAVNPVPPVGRTILSLCEIRANDDSFDLIFDPAGILDIFVIYRFSSDGHMLWKIAES